MFIFDAHLDLSMNAMEWNRDLRNNVNLLRQLELGMNDKPDRGRATVSFPDLRKGNVGIVVATQIARFVKTDSLIPGWNSPQQAWAQTQAQVAWYKCMEEEGEIVAITDRTSLQKHVALWNDGTPNDDKPIGYILSLEGADSIVDISYLEKAYNYGLRAIGPAHYGPGRYANGTDATGKMDKKGIELLKEMERLNIILDATHLCDDAFWQALDHYNGPVWASHNNCRTLVNHNRQYDDEQIKELIARGAVIGGALDAWMLVPDWKRGVSTPLDMQCNLETVFKHMDHICQLAGNALHVGVGSDLDGAFGTEQCPYDLDTIADLQKLVSVFRDHGYSENDLKNIFHQNWINFLMKNWS
ncbi:peptidase M19 [Elizabethkingia sp. HvH-WGS333]|uniref:dipeptidase n=1 Tax=Elizabethkingia TaxID=308865 RepID=UPI00074165FA|nr:MULTISPECIES: membrane dipeptidase [Elizabethkingia]KUG12910.1 peptidase M19 [Elizabethkingia miricola]MCL1655560.1 membrane dipeptidase [Elizabethkingia miricola]MCP1250857.1 membrane dipeptidase [Elizabethkingia sp. S0634]MDX8570424.1 membrane dipeptidase [Elizabethkingia sp. HX QKY]OIK45641.1 peptidase M19 [Elizabethkingia sp. HvH-WGS333]